MGAAKAELLRAIKNNLAHPSLASMLQHILAVLDEDSHSHRQSFMNRTQHCFAIKNGADGLLDTARATFCRITEEIHALIESYTDEIDQNIKVSICSSILLAQSDSDQPIPLHQSKQEVDPCLWWIFAIPLQGSSQVSQPSNSSSTAC